MAFAVLMHKDNLFGCQFQALKEKLLPQFGNHLPLLCAVKQ